MEVIFVPKSALLFVPCDNAISRVNLVAETHVDLVAADPPSTLHTPLRVTELESPLSLAKVLVKDRHAITINGKWTKLPARVTVRQIFDEVRTKNDPP